MSDILDDYREWADEHLQQHVSTHSDRCHLWHDRCMIHRLAAALQAARLTDAEREAIKFFARLEVGANCNIKHAATLRGLLERHCPTPENQPQQDNAHQTHSTTVECRERHGWIPVGERLLAENALLKESAEKLYDIAASGAEPSRRRRMLDRMADESFAEDG